MQDVRSSKDSADILAKPVSALCTAWKVSKYGVFSVPYFPVFGLNMEIYGVKNSVFGHFSHSVVIHQSPE